MPTYDKDEDARMTTTKALTVLGTKVPLAPIHLTRRGKLVKFRQLSNSRKWSTTDHQLLPAAKHHSSFFIIFSLEIKIKCLLSFANPSFQTPKVPTGISYVNLKEPSPVESARLQILTPKWMIIGKGKSKLLNNPSALPIARGFITRLLYSKTSANSSGLGSTEDWLFFKAYEIKSF